MSKSYVLVAVLAAALAGCVPFERSTHTSNPQALREGDGAPGIRPSDVSAIRALGSSAKGRCVTCHGDVGFTPHFMSSNVNQARAEIKAFINLDAPESSVLLMRSQNGHYGTSGVRLPEADWMQAIAAYVVSVKGGDDEDASSSSSSSSSSNSSSSSSSSSSSGAGSGGGGAEDLSAVRALGIPAKGNCTACHGDGGRFPRFMNSNLALAVSEARMVVNILLPASSKIVTQSQNLHYSPVGVQLPEADWINAVTIFTKSISGGSSPGSSGSSSGSSSGGGSSSSAGASGSSGTSDIEIDPESAGILPTARVKVPAVIPTYVQGSGANLPANFALLTFDLGPSGFPGSKITMKLAMDDKVTDTYKLYQPKLHNASGKAITLQGLRLRLNGNFLVGIGGHWSSVHQHSAPGDNAVLSASPAILPVVVRATDDIQLAFDRLEVARNQVACTQLAVWTAKIKPIMGDARHNCTNCHKGTGATGLAFDATGTDDATVCAKYLGRANLIDAGQSAIIHYQMQGMTGHPFNIANDYLEAEQQEIRSWIIQEARGHP